VYGHTLDRSIGLIPFQCHVMLPQHLQSGCKHLPPAADLFEPRRFDSLTVRGEFVIQIGDGVTR